MKKSLYCLAVSALTLALSGCSTPSVISQCQPLPANLRVRPQPLPPVAASNTTKPVTWPDQSAVGAGNVMALLFDVVPDDPDDAVVVPAPCVPAQFAREDVTATRA